MAATAYRHWVPLPSLNTQPPFRMCLRRQISQLQLTSHRFFHCSPSTDFDREHLFNYTTGRWLWGEKEKLAERYRWFDVAELKRVAAESVGARRCVSMGKIAEGNSSRILRLRMDDGKLVFARIPYADVDAGCLSRAIASEVATMDFARTVLGIPVPEVLSWSGNTENVVQSQYVLMGAATGTPLWKSWNKMGMDRKLKIVDELIGLEKKFLSLSFTRYGNLYLASDAFPGCEKAEIQGHVTQAIKDDVARRFVIGPVTARSFWHRERALMDIDRGPWEHAQDYLRAVAQREISWIARYADSKTQRSSYQIPFSMLEPPMQRDISKHIAQYLQLQDVAEHLLPKGEESRATLWHPNIWEGNIFAQNDRITGIVDWLDAWAGPLFLQAKRSSLVTNRGNTQLELPDNYATMDEHDQRCERRQVEETLISRAYVEKIKTRNPFLDSIYNIPHAQNRRRVVTFAESTWDGDVLALRQMLIRVIRHWDETHPSIACPISFTEKEYKEHHPYVEDWNLSAETFDMLYLQLGIGRDGFVIARNYEAVVEMIQEVLKVANPEGDPVEVVEDWERKMRMMFK